MQTILVESLNNQKSEMEREREKKITLNARKKDNQMLKFGESIVFKTPKTTFFAHCFQIKLMVSSFVSF